jgi:hypothetical protein
MNLPDQLAPVGVVLPLALHLSFLRPALCLGGLSVLAASTLAALHRLRGFFTLIRKG